MGKLGIIATVGALLLLTGCAAQPTTAAPQTPTPTPPANAESCESFSAATMGLGGAFEDESTKDDWEAIRVQMDEVALTAAGDVKTRLAELVEEWPSYADVIIHDGMTTVNDLLHSVGRACKADGSEVEYNYLITG